MIDSVAVAGAMNGVPAEADGVSLLPGVQSLDFFRRRTVVVLLVVMNFPGADRCNGNDCVIKAKSRDPLRIRFI